MEKIVFLELALNIHRDKSVYNECIIYKLTNHCR